MVQLEEAPHQVVLRGKIWARAFKRTVRPTRPFTRVTAAFVFSHDMHDDLTDEEMMKVAMLGRAVSPVTSYLAIEPGVRPSTEGIERLGNGGGAGGGYGRGRGGFMYRAAWMPPDLAALLQEGVDRCVEIHNPAGSAWSASLTVHTTLDEIVDVLLKGAPNALRACIVEAAWQVRLTPEFDAQHETYELDLP